MIMSKAIHRILLITAGLLLFTAGQSLAQGVAPTLDPIGPQSVTENVLLTINVTASDDLDTPSLSASPLPSGANFTDNGDGTGTFTWTPTFLHGGTTYDVTFTATDTELLTDDEIVTITVNDAGNQPPVLAAIGPQSTTENVLLTINVSASDIEDTPSLSASPLPTGASFLDNGDGTGTFTWTPTFLQGGTTYDVTFTASDDTLATDNELVTITVIEAGNQAPVVGDIPGQTVSEGTNFVTISLDTYVADPDNADADIIWSYSGNTDLSVSIDVNRVATITAPTVDWNGSETITFTATDPGLLADSDPATFTVTAINDAPVVGDIPGETIPEGASFATIDLNTYVSDVDNLDNEITWSYSGNASLSVSIDAGNIATVSTPNPDWNGTETITFTATDPGLLSDSDPATFTVTAVNDAPVVGDIPDQTIPEGSAFASITLDNYVTDIDNLASEITWSYSGNAELSVSIVNRVVSITIPDSDWNGSESITFTATDPGLLSDSDPVVFTVTAVNDAPVVGDIPDQTIDEGSTFATINLDTYVSDVDNLASEMNWTYSGNTELTVSIDINRVATITIPNVEWSGTETITFTATDPGLLSSGDDAVFTVNAINDAPVVSDIPDQTIAEGATFATIDLDSYVTDVDDLPSEMSWSVSGNTELSVSIDVDRIATITIPNADWNGSETITFTATDPGLLFASDPATFTVTGVNDAPVVSDIPNQTIPEGSSFTTITLDNFVTDIDNLDSEIDWTYSGNTELTVSIDAGRIATITIPDPEWSGSETITFTATDLGLLSDSDPATFTVTAVNDAPVVGDIPDQTIEEGTSFTAINLDDYVSDIDNLISELTWSYSGNSQLNVSIVNRVAIVSAPGANWNGAETITFTATDPGLLSGSNPAVFTVTGVNDAPVVSNIPSQTVAEGNLFATITLDNYVSDIDNADAEMTWSYAGNSELIVSIDFNRIATITVPDPQWNGSETIIFTATDPGLLNSSDPATFTVTAVDNAPLVSDIPDQTIAEGGTFTTISLDDYVADPDNIDSDISWTYSGNVDLIVSIDVNRIATITTPDANWNGSELITFTATDPSVLSNSDPATFTVTPVNDAPVVADIPNQTITEGLNFGTINLDGYVTDFDNLASEMTWSYSGNTALTVSIDANRIATITAPSLDWVGSETITFTATDPGLLTDSDPVTFTVTNVNDAPVVADIPNQTVSEGAPFATINLNSFVSDIDNLDAEISWTYSGNTNLSVSIDINRIATVTPLNENWNGSETITFTATDPGLLSDSDPATFTVTAINDAPVVSDIPNQSVAEGGTFATINLDNYVADVDNIDADITWSYSGNTELTVSIVNRLAIIGIPNANWNGSETITFTATDPGLLNSSDDATFTVNAVNDAPVVTDIPSQTITEGATFTTINLDTYVSDIDNPDAAITWTYLGNTQLSVSIDINRVATITIPNADWNGSETITFTATDPGLLADSDPATFTVTAVNDAPVVSDIPDQTIDEGQAFATINLDNYVTDVDNLDNTISWSYSGTTELSVSINASRVATITAPSPEWGGSETITFTATDPGLLTDNDAATFTINALNDAPVVSDIPNQTVAEGSTFTTITLDNYVTDIDNVDSEMNWSYSGNTQLTVSIDINRVATITIPNADWNGSETITFTATDPGLLSDSDPATFTVTGVNDAPVVSDIPNQTIAEGATFATINLDNYVTDIDNLDNEMTWSYSGNTELTVSIGVNRIATITTPSPTWNGSEVITFTATDPGLLFDSDPATFTVSAVNNSPVVSDIPNQTISEGGTFTTINLDSYVSDVDNLDSEISWSYSGNVDLIVSIGANRIATITTPNINWFGSENITFTATDPSLLSNSDQATFTVTPQNDAPVVSDIPNQTIAEGANFTTINLDNYVSDVDNLDSEMGWTYAGNTQLNVSITNRVAIVSTPNINWNGSETITFTATDPGGLSSFDAATFTVTAVNDAPVVTDIPDQTIAEGATFTTINLDSYVSDADNLDSEMEWSFVGNSQLTVSINVNRVATITIPSLDWNGTETITFRATDPGLASDADPATFTVTAVNDAPVVSDIPNQTIDEGASFATIALDIYVTDVDNADNTISWTFSGNTELTVVIDANRIATITPPSSGWFGSETITFTATDPGLLTDNDAAAFTVTSVNDAPVVTNIPNQTIAEGATFATITLDNFVSDVDNTDSEMNWSYSGNTQLAVSIDINRIATITVPNADWNGSETITFTATDPGLLSDSDPATFTVTAVNDAPVVADIPDQTIAEGGTFATINLNNYVTDVDNADNQISWSYSGNSALTVVIDINRIATITTPSPTWNGNETITFTATDPGSLTDNDGATFTVTAVDNAPIVSDIPNQTISEGGTFTTITLDSFVSDPDNIDSDITWSYSGNVNLIVSIDVNRIATITTPNVNWFGSENITFTATDPSLLSNSDQATFTVSAINDQPVVSDIPNQTISEGASFTAINLDDYVSDVDNQDSEMSWSYAGNVQLSVSITNRVAIVSTPNADWSGVESITFTATDPGGLSAFNAATFTVTAVNDAPVVANIPDQTVAEGSTFTTINLDSYVSDVDNLDSEIGWSFVGNTQLTISVNVNRVATITIPNVNWNGSETITFTATDPGLLTDSDPATFTVTAVNDAPVVSDIPNQTIAEGTSFATINLDNFVTDIDNLDSDISWTYEGNTSLTVSIDVNRVATITTPSPTWNGSETITFTATDPGLLTDNDAATFTVTAVNNAPVVTDIPNQTISEGGTFATITLDNYVSDIDNVDSDMSWSYSGNTQLTVSISPSRVATITIPNADWNGSEIITFTATDPGLLADSDPATFTVTAVNDAPVVSDIPNQTIDEGQSFATINLDNYVADIDNLDSDINWSYTGNTQLTVSINASRIATITAPSADWSGSESITFTATDPGLLTDSDPATFTIGAVNDAPVVSNIPDQTIAEGATFATINLDNFVTDIDNVDSDMDWSYSGNTQLTVSIGVNRIATITIPNADWNGSETITFTATDPGLLSDSDPATFTVTGVNDAPVVSDIPNQTIAEGAAFATINLDNYVTDIDNLDNQITWSYSGNTELTVAIDINRVATITPPSPTWNGSETITFTATDPGLLSDNEVATFTVSAVNNSPVVSDIPNQTISEGGTFTTINLDSYVSDVDNLDSEISWSYSGNVDLIVSIGANRIATITTPNVNWFGSENITFTATDPSLLSNSDQATFTVTPLNDAPVVSDIPNQTIAEGANFTAINLDDYISDVDNLDSEMGWTYAGNTQLTVSITNRVAIVSTPNVNWNGSETITFTATDPGGLSSFNAATFTVTAVNDAPVVTDIPDQTIAEGATFTTINLDSYVSDADNLDSEMEWSFVGNSQLTVSINVNRVATITIPSPDWNGSETITFRATDPGLLTDNDDATFTVTGVNDAPVVSDIPDQTIAEGAAFVTVSLDNFVADVDNLDSEISWSFSGNTELTVVIDGNRVATITAPSSDWNGSETITFTATDPGLLTDNDAATFTVTSVNNAPVVSNIPNQTVSEGGTFTTITLDSYVTDIDNTADEMNWTYSGNTQLTVSIDASRIATITIPNADWNGSETITFTATDPGLLSDSDPATFTVTAVNDAPVVTDIPNQTIAEGATFATISLDNYVSDVDNADNTLSWSFAGNTELNVVIDINRVATITTPSPNWNGSETITFTVIDPGLLTDNDAATFTVSAVNNAPVVSDIPNQTIAEGGTFTTIALDNYVTDVDNTDSEITWSYSGNVDLIVSIDVNRIATITTPNVNWFGSENITFTATDPSLLSNSDQATFTVSAINDQPVVSDIPNQTISEGASFTAINLDDYVSDVDNQDSEMSWSYAGNVQLSVSITNRVAIVSTPNADWSGVESITFTATDPGGLSAFNAATFTVTAVNDAPVVANIPDQTVAEGATFTTINLDSYVSDVDNLDSEIGWSFVGNTQLTISVNVNRVATITIPNVNWNGSETITFTATDPGLLTDSDPATFTVTAVNDAPVVSDIPNQTIAEGASFATISLDNFVTDIDNLDGDISWTYEGNTSLTVSIDVNRVATITAPFPDWNGSETITFTATDPGLLTDNDAATFTITPVNDAPVLAAIGPRSTLENVPLTFGVSATDIETIPALTASPLPTGASFIDNGDGTGTFSWTPDYLQSGIYNVTFTATDDQSATDFEVVTITVNESGNQPPVLATIGPQSTTENVLLTFGVSATDIEDTPSLSAAPLPTGASFVDNGDGTGTFTWTPTFLQGGTSYNVTFTATDDTLATDFEVVTITVTEAGNRLPILATIGAQSTTENVLLTFGISATDIESTPTLTAAPLPTGASFIDNGDGTGTFNWTPTFLQSGSYNVTFTATDDSTATDFELVTITVIEAGNQLPVLATIGPRSGVENVLLTFGISATDIESTPALSAAPLPAGANFVDNGNGTGTFSWTPGFLQSGVYDVTFTATDDSTATDFEVVTISVIDAGNQLPVLATIGARNTTENVNLNFAISATDAESIPALTATSLPTGATFTDNGDGTGTFDWTPDFLQSGSYDVTFTATDDSLATDIEVVTISVNDAGNQLPILAAIGPQSVGEGANLNFTISATDIESVPTLTATSLPPGATFIDNGDGTGAFDWTPDFTQDGNYDITFTATDDSLATDFEIVTVTVTDAGNQPPVLNPIGPRSVDENVLLTFNVSASDLDATFPALSASPLPSGAVFTDNGDGTGSFSWMPDYFQAGIYNINFVADDEITTDEELVTITVNNINRAPTADAGADQFDVRVGTLVTLDGTASADPDLELLNYDWVQTGGPTVFLSEPTASQPTFTPVQVGLYQFELTVDDGDLFSSADAVEINVINSAPPEAVADLAIARNGDAIDLSWSEVTLDTDGLVTQVNGYIIYRDTTAYFTPESADSIGFVDEFTFNFTDNNLNGADVVGDINHQYFYTVAVLDDYDNRSVESNRVGEYDYRIVTTSTTDFNLICIPFANTGINTAIDLIAAIGQSNVLTVNNYQPLSQSFESRFAAGFGVNFNIVVGRVYQVNAAAPTTFTVVGEIPAPGAVIYNLVTTATTDFSFISIPFEREGDFSVAQDVLNNLPGSFNTLNRFDALSQSYESRFAVGFGVNFQVKAGMPYQANSAQNAVFPGP